MSELLGPWWVVRFADHRNRRIDRHYVIRFKVDRAARPSHIELIGAGDSTADPATDRHLRDAMRGAAERFCLDNQAIVKGAIALSEGRYAEAGPFAAGAARSQEAAA